MAEPLQWLSDGTPYSARFGDRYHSSANAGLDQAEGVFLRGCGLPHAWAGQAQWRILETGFGLGLNFLVTWAAWRADAQRPRLLHFVSTEAWPVSAEDLLRAHAAHPQLALLAQQLHDQFWGLLPGVHRLSFEGGRVLLTLCIGDAQTLLRQQDGAVDAVYLDGFSPQCNPDIWSLHTLKAVARWCRRGTRLATWCVARSVRDALAQCGFVVQRVPGVPPKRENLHAIYNPHWEPRRSTQTVPVLPPVTAPGRCIVIGGGLAGAATAASLARRGWQVEVLDQADAPAAGASALPAGVFAPHVSPDDSVLSRLSRSGVRIVLEHAQMLQAQGLLRAGVDWQCSGVLEHRVDGSPGLPPEWESGPGADWSRRASAETLQLAACRTLGVDSENAPQRGWFLSDSPPHSGTMGQEDGKKWAAAAHSQPTVPKPDRLLAQLPVVATACWHLRAGWIRPARLVTALLAQPGIGWHGNAHVDRLQRSRDGAHWQALDAQGRVLAEAERVVIAAGAGSRALLAQRWALRPLRGQISWARWPAGVAPMLPYPVNGHGNWVPSFPLGDEAEGPRAWVLGSTFERGVDHLPPTPDEQRAAHAANWHKLQTLLPAAAQQLQASFAPFLDMPGPHAISASASPLQSWAAVRCVAPDRLPIVGPVEPHALPGLWVCTAMGARGLTLALLCAELLAARWHDEPLPLEGKLARALAAERLG
ncbi:MAG: tRNA (5-methylaminomethyl-2-thiouridine)(34)-methyltransferase MnmD [Pseudomonadota bacterium]